MTPLTWDRNPLHTLTHHKIGVYFQLRGWQDFESCGCRFESYHVCYERNNYMSNTWRMAEKEGQQLYEIAMSLKPTIILETGTHQGYSGMWFLKALKDLQQGMLITIDILSTEKYDKLNKEQLLENHIIAKHNLQSISNRFVQITAGEPDVDVIDLLFIDGDHSFKGCLNDLNAYYPKLRKGGICLLHDFHGIQVPAAFEEFFYKNKPHTEFKDNSVFKNDLLIIYKD